MVELWATVTHHRGPRPLHDSYQQPTAVAWLGIVACQMCTAFAADIELASLQTSTPGPPDECSRLSGQEFAASSTDSGECVDAPESVPPG